MKITFMRTGGFAGLRLASTVDTQSLPAEEARLLEGLVEGASFFDLPASMPSPTGSADRFQYHIAIEAPAGQHVIDVGEAALTEKLRPLVDRLSVLARSPH